MVILRSKALIFIGMVLFGIVLFSANYISLQENFDKEYKKANSQSLDIMVNVRTFGAKGDGLTNDAVNIQKAINYCKIKSDSGTICTLFFPVGNYYIGKTKLTVNTIKFNLKMDGCFFVDPGVKRVLEIINGSDLNIEFKLKGNKYTQSNFIYSQDYSQNVSGLDVGLYLEGCCGVKLNADFYHFYGRGIEAIGCINNNWDHIYGNYIGQTIFVKQLKNSTKSGFGSIGYVNTTELAGSYFNAVDLTIPYYENIIIDNSQKKGVIFDHVVSLWVDSLSVGNNSDKYCIEFWNCSNINIPIVYAYGHWDKTNPTDSCEGIYLKECNDCNMKINTSHIKNNAVTINGIKNSNLEVIDSYSQNIGIIRATSTCTVNNTELRLFSRNREGTGVLVENISNNVNAIDGLSIAINATSRAIGNPDDRDLIVKDSNARITILPSTRAVKIDLPQSNKVKDINSSTGTFTNKPLYRVDNIYNIDLVPTVNLSGYTLATSLDNKITRIGHSVSGTISIQNSTNNGNINANDIIATFDIKLAPMQTVIIPVVCLTSNDYQTIYCSVENDGTKGILKAQTTVATNNVKLIIANFSYFCNR